MAIDGRKFGIVPTNLQDWVENLVFSLDPYTQKIAHRKIFNTYRRGLSPDSLLRTLKQLSAISISRKASLASGIKDFSYIGKQTQDHLIPKEILRFRSPSPQILRTQGRIERAGLPSWIDRTRYKAGYKSVSDTSPRSDFFDELMYPLATLEDAKEFSRIREKDKRSDRFRRVMSGTGIHTGEEATEEERRAEASRLNRAYWEGVSGVYGPSVPSDIAAKRWNEGARRTVLGQDNYRYDMLSDFNQRMEDLTERYGGDRNKAEEKYKKELNKNLPMFFRNSKMTAKQMYNLSKGLSFGKSAFGVGSLIAGAVIGTTKAISHASDSANSRIVGIENLQNLYGKPSRDVFNAGLLAGMSPEQITKTHGKLLTKFGGVKPLMNVAKGIASQSPLARVAVAEQLGLDENMMAFLDILAGTGRIKNTEHRQMAAKKILTEYQKASMLKTGSSLSETIIGFIGDSSVGARFADDIKMKVEDAKNRANESSSLPSQGTTQPSDGTATSGNQISFSIGNVNVDADNPAEFIAGMREVASARGGQTLARTFDSGVMA